MGFELTVGITEQSGEHKVETTIEKLSGSIEVSRMAGCLGDHMEYRPS